MDRVMASTVYRLNSYLFDRLPVRNFLGSLLFNALDSAKISASMQGQESDESPFSGSF